jgi:hypothetical protein
MGPASAWASSWERNFFCFRELKLGPSSTDRAAAAPISSPQMFHDTNMMLFTLRCLSCVCISPHGFILFFACFVIGRPKLKFRFNFFPKSKRIIHSLRNYSRSIDFQGEFSRECDLVLTSSNSSIFLSPPPNLPSSCLRLISRLLVLSIFLSMMCFRRRFARNMTNPVSLPSVYCM